jgi:hypothetical protein
LDPGDQIIYHENCSRATGLDTVPGIFLICDSNCYFIPHFRGTVRDGEEDFEEVMDSEGHHEMKCDRWAYENISEIHKRRYVLFHNAGLVSLHEFMLMI